MNKEQKIEIAKWYGLILDDTEDGLVLRNQIGTGFGERKYGLRGLEFVTVSPMFFDPENDANQLRDLETRMRKESGEVR